MAVRTLAIRRDDRCHRCGLDLPAGTRAAWDSIAKVTSCVTCPDAAAPEPSSAPPPDRGTAGASAAREYERRKTSREHRIRAKHPHVGGLILALSDEPQHQRAWEQGQRGEQLVAELLERATADGPAVLLHDRRIPGSRANIDHLAVTPSGVFVIDAKHVSGKVRVDAPLLGKPKLLVAGRDRTTLIDKLDEQVRVVTEALGPNDPPAVHGVLCFTKANLPLLGTARMRGHLLLYRKALAKRLNAPGPVGPPAIGRTAGLLGAALPPA